MQMELVIQTLVYVLLIVHILEHIFNFQEMQRKK